MSEKPSAERLVEMLGAVADAANGAASAEEAFRVALEEMCDATGWPAGHVYAAGPNGSLTDIGTWPQLVAWRRLRRRHGYGRG